MPSSSACARSVTWEPATQVFEEGVPSNARKRRGASRSWASTMLNVSGAVDVALPAGSTAFATST
ncbi:hypothetical protein COSO111634_23400 [Corallococcus soli]